MVCTETISLCLARRRLSLFLQWKQRKKGRTPSIRLHFSLPQNSLVKRVKGRILKAEQMCSLQKLSFLKVRNAEH
jgi:hypothetical protein